MSDESQAKNSESTNDQRKKRGMTIDEKIAKLEEELQQLAKKKSEMVKKERERNSKAVLAIFAAEGMLDVSAELWKSKLAEVKKVLGVSA